MLVWRAARSRARDSLMASASQVDTLVGDLPLEGGACSFLQADKARCEPYSWQLAARLKSAVGRQNCKRSLCS